MSNQIFDERTYGQILNREPIKVQLGRGWFHLIPQTATGFERMEEFCKNELGKEYGEQGTISLLLDSPKGKRLILKEALREHHPEADNPDWQNKLLGVMSQTSENRQLANLAAAFFSEMLDIERKKAGSSDSPTQSDDLKAEVLSELTEALS